MAKKAVSKNTKSEYWFPAKKYGFGWGLPITRQGWIAFIGFLTVGLAPLMYVSFVYKGDTYCNEIIKQGIAVSCDPNAALSMYLLAAFFWLTACILMLIHICNKKGEPTSWRWGKKTHATKP